MSFRIGLFLLELIDVTKKANLNQLYQMRLRLTPDPAIPLAAGMSVNVTIDYEAEATIDTVVPLSAIFQDKEKSSEILWRGYVVERLGAWIDRRWRPPSA